MGCSSCLDVDGFGYRAGGRGLLGGAGGLGGSTITDLAAAVSSSAVCETCRSICPRALVNPSSTLVCCSGSSSSSWTSPGLAGATAMGLAGFP